MPKVSIIIPVYKVEKYIHECLNSIKNQTFSDWECILIDDGSPDLSGQICDEYANEDSRFRVFHVENGGVSKARNIGLNEMSGKWVMFVDSDDLIALDTLSICLSKMESHKLDLLQFSFTRKIADLNKHDNVFTDVLSLEGYIKERKFIVCVGGSLLLSSIIKDYRLSFDTTLKLAEDQIFMYQYMNLAERLQRVDNMLYYYRDNTDSATSHQKSDDIEKSIKNLSDYKKRNKHWSDVIDKVNILFVVDLILNNDRTNKQIADSLRLASVTSNVLLTGIYKLFYYLCQINTSLAILFIKKRYAKKIIKL